MSELTLKQWKEEHFKAFAVANSLADRVADAFAGREFTSLTDEEQQLIIPLLHADPMGVVAQALDIKDGIVVRWADGDAGQAFWKSIADIDKRWCEEHQEG